MSELNSLKRYLWLYDYVKQHPYTPFEAIKSKFDNSGLAVESQTCLAKRTFHRAQTEMSELFGIEIKYNKQHKGYYIEENDLTDSAKILLDSFRMIHVFQTFANSKHIAPEAKRTGSEHLLTVLNAIEKRKIIEFDYQRNKGSREIKQRKVAPFFVKEYKGRWYVIGRDQSDLKIKTFALERIKDGIWLDYDSFFEIPETATSEIFFKNSFGMYRLDDAPVETIELAFSPLKGRFLKTTPLHHSQKVLIDNESEFRITVELQVTIEFIMEILSHGEEVRVVSPDSFREEVVGKIEKMRKNYE